MANQVTKEVLKNIFLSNEVVTDVTLDSTNVKVSQELTSGLQIATISVDGVPSAIYCPQLSGEIDYLSNAISSKIFVKDNITSTEKNVTTLSIVQYNADTLYTSDVGTDTKLCSDTLYVYSDTFMNAFGRQLCNLTMNNSTNPNENYEGIAVTDAFIRELSNVIDSRLKQLSIDIINELRN